MPETGHEKSEPSVLTERRDRVLVVTLNRPAQRNAIDADLANRLWAAIEEINVDPGLTAGVLTGAGRGFCSGMDLKAFARGGQDMSAVTTFATRGCDKPLVAAVEGFALAGGLELALSCDLIVAARDARFGIPEVKRGLFAAGGGVIRLPARIGYAKAMELAVTGDPISAEEAERFGLVSRVTEPGGALDGAVELAGRIAANAPLAVVASKRLIRATQGATEDELWQLQRELAAEVFTSDDAKEGPAAFAEKREPRWTGT